VRKPMIRRIDTKKTQFDTLVRMIKRPSLEGTQVSPRVQASLDKMFGPGTTPAQAVAKIVGDIAQKGDEALFQYLRQIDGVDLTGETLFVTPYEIEQARSLVDKNKVKALLTAKERIEKYHRKQLTNSWFYSEVNGNWLGQQIVPLDSVGCYVPGGRYPLVSSALMAIIPAKVAGVRQIIAATPCNREGLVNPYIIIACQEAGAQKILKAGGAQAVAAMAYGTATVPAVDKIVGPGNIFVTLAKKLVFGQTGIDSLAGPSEILIIADESANPAWIAADMLSQAEHDSEAATVLLTTQAELADKVTEELEKQLQALPRREEAEESLQHWGMIVTCQDLSEAVDLVNLIASEHLEIMVSDPESCLSRIKNAGGIFVGSYASEPIGDYVAGCNHILPTNRSARFASPLGVEQFIKRSGVLRLSKDGLNEIGPIAVELARLEGLEAHARAVEIRLKEN
jgi:histidinol dehydrogenase